MKNIFFVLTFLIASGLPAGALEIVVSTNPLNLPGAYVLALHTSETLQIQEEEIRRAEALYMQARAGILPNVGWKWTQFYQDTVRTTDTEGVTSTLNRTRTPQSYVYLNQPLFKGFREFSAMKGSKAQTERNRWLYKQAQRDLLGEVANVFFTALIAEQDVTILSESLRLTHDRTQELRRRVRLGKSRRAEVLSSDAELASLEAEVLNQKRILAIARESLRFLTRVDAGVPLLAPNQEPPVPNLNESLKRAGIRPDLLAAEQEIKIAYYQKKYAEAGHWPFLTFEGRYYTERVGFQEDIQWDALFTLDLPVYQGGLVQGQVRDARSLEIEAQLNRARLVRQIDREVRTAHADLLSALEQNKVYRRAVDLAQENYSVQQGEYRLGLINNLEIIRILSDVETLRRQAARTWATAWLDDIQLRIATGEGLERVQGPE